MRTVGQFSITKWAGGWMAEAQVSSNETQAFFSDTEASCVRKVHLAYDRGIVPMCAVPSDRKVICDLTITMDVENRPIINVT